MGCDYACDWLNSPAREAPEVRGWVTEDLVRRLVGHGYQPGPVALEVEGPNVEGIDPPYRIKRDRVSLFVVAASGP